MHRCAAVLLLSLAACGPFFRGGEEGDARDRLTLCVENATIAYGNLVARAGPVRFDVMPGQQVCKPLMATGGFILLRASTTGGGIGGPRTYEARLPVSGYRCWRWRLTDSPASSADLNRCPAEPDEAEADTTAGGCSGAFHAAPPPGGARAPACRWSTRVGSIGGARVRCEGAGPGNDSRRSDEPASRNAPGATRTRRVVPVARA